MKRFKVATANTLLGQASRDMIGLGEVLETDILLLQEIVSSEADRLKEKLAEVDFELVAASSELGLAIAINKNSGIELLDGSTHTKTFARLSWFERLLIKILVKQPTDFSARGLLSIKLKMPNLPELTIINVHPGVSFGSKRPRRRQIMALNQELQKSYYYGPLIIAGDMNHYPGPESIDLTLAKDNGLIAVDLQEQPTWITRGSHYEKFARLAMVFNRKKIESYDAQMDSILYRPASLKALDTRLIKIKSDHRAVMTTFELH